MTWCDSQPSTRTLSPQSASPPSSISVFCNISLVWAPLLFYFFVFVCVCRLSHSQVQTTLTQNGWHSSLMDSYTLQKEHDTSYCTLMYSNVLHKSFQIFWIWCALLMHMKAAAIQDLIYAITVNGTTHNVKVILNSQRNKCPWAYTFFPPWLGK